MSTPVQLTIHKVRITRKQVVIEYANGVETHSIKSRDTPLPAFVKAVEALAPLTCELLGLPSTYVENMKATGLTVTDAKGNEMVTLVAQKSLPDASGPFNIATPLRFLAHPQEEGSYTPPLTPAQAALVDEVIEQAKAYVSGSRAQGQIQFDGDEDDEPEVEHHQAEGGNTLAFPDADSGPDETVEPPAEKPKRRGRKAAAGK